MLELRAVSKRYGGVVATDDVTLDVTRGEVHALIGPNGAGKTTLIGQISGALETESGRIIFNGADITRLPAHARVAAGLARSYQITSIFRRFSVLDNLALAVQARSGSSFRYWRPGGGSAALRAGARHSDGNRTARAAGERRRPARARRTTRARGRPCARDAAAAPAAR